MVTLKIDNQLYGIGFQYREVRLSQDDHGAQSWTEGPGPSAAMSTRTVCRILKLTKSGENETTGEVICEGQVTCSLADKFLKSEGRQKSLTKALADGAQGWHPSRKVRRQIWSAYWANHNDLHKSGTEDALRLLVQSWKDGDTNSSDAMIAIRDLILPD